MEGWNFDLIFRNLTWLAVKPTICSLVLNTGDFSLWAMKKNFGCLGYIGDYTTQIYGDYDKPL